MKSFRDTKRRTKQRLLQSLRLVHNSVDSEFEAEHGEYSSTVQGIKSIQSAMRAHLDALRHAESTSAQLTVQLAAFHQGTEAEDRARELGQAHAELERIQLASVERLYEEEVVSAADLLLWQVPEVEDRVKARKNLLLDFNAHMRKFESSKSQLVNSQNQPMNSAKAGSGGVFGRRKSESEMEADVATRKVKVEHAERAVQESTEWLLSQFQSLSERRESGEILEGPMSAFLACQLHIARDTVRRLEAIQNMFQNYENYTAQLSEYDEEFAKTSPLDLDGFAHMAGHANRKMRQGKSLGSYFGQPLSTGAPTVVRDAMAYIEQHGLTTEGIFRVPGSSDIVGDLRARYDAGEPGVLNNTPGLEPHDVATLLKLYFRELPEPLITTDQYHDLLAAIRGDLEITSPGTVQAVCEVAMALPKYHRECLGLLLHFLQRVAECASENKMNTANLATCFAPSLLRAPEDTPPHVVLSDMQVAIAAVRVLIDNADVFPDPRSAPKSSSKSSMAPPMRRDMSGSARKTPAPLDASFASVSQRRPLEAGLGLGFDDD